MDSHFERRFDGAVSVEMYTDEDSDTGSQSTYDSKVDSVCSACGYGDHPLQFAFDILFDSGIVAGRSYCCNICARDHLDSLEDDDFSGYVYYTEQDLYPAANTGELMLGYEAYRTFEDDSADTRVVGFVNVCFLFEAPHNRERGGHPAKKIKVLLDEDERHQMWRLAVRPSGVARHHRLKSLWKAFRKGIEINMEHHMDLDDCWTAWTCLPGAPAAKRAAVAFHNNVHSFGDLQVGTFLDQQ